MNEALLGAVGNLVVALVSLAFTWLIGHRLAMSWAIRQKRKELELATAERFYRQYGEFFAIWKLWNYAVRELRDTPQRLEQKRSDLLERATQTEAEFEATLVKLASERLLHPGEQSDLGKLRQGFQFLRGCIRDGQPLPWRTSQDPQYLEFKRLACTFSAMLSMSPTRRIPTVAEAAAAHEEITSNRYEAHWRLPEVTDDGQPTGRLTSG